jgi:addiction module HigA family antidote
MPTTLRSSIITEEIVMAKKLLDPIPPGEILLEEFMRPLGVSINRLARDIGVPPNRISGIVNGNRSITADTALRLGRFFGTSAETWLDLQSDYDLRMIRRTAGDAIQAQVRVLAV